MKHSAMAPTQAARIAAGTAFDVGHSIILVVSVHLALLVCSCSLACFASTRACCLLLLIVLASGWQGADPGMSLK
jgi:hypothetical protein